ncbi:hypothetical protein Landi51_04828 [Colletotrichum acutatum]
MCQPTDPYCWFSPTHLESNNSLDSLDKPLPYNPEPIASQSLAQARENRVPLPPAGLSRILFFPRHTSTVTHLPVYDVNNIYNKAVKGAPMGSGMYKINMMFMRRPKGDGMDSNVEYFINVAPDQSLVTVHQRSVVLNDTYAITVTLPYKRQEESALEVPGLGNFHVIASRFPPNSMEKNEPSQSKFRQYPALAMASNDHPGTQWQLRPQDPGSLCYHLTELNQSNHGEKPEPHIMAVYHYAGGHPHHPVDHSEGVLLLPNNRDPQREMAAIGLVFLLLWHMRDLECSRENILWKLLGRLGARKPSG